MSSGATVISSKHHHLLLLRAEISRSSRVLMQLVVVSWMESSCWTIDAPLAVAVVMHRLIVVAIIVVLHFGEEASVTLMTISTRGGATRGILTSAPYALRSADH